jgi:integrase
MARKYGIDRGITQRKGRDGWWVRLYVSGREKWYRADNKSQAKALYGRLKAEIREGRYFPEKFRHAAALTVRAWLIRYLEGCTNRGLLNEKRYARRWSLLLGKRLLPEITTEELRQIQAKLKASGRWTDSTINRHFSFLRHVLLLAVKDGKLDRNPMAGVKFFPEAQRTRFLTDGELHRLKGIMPLADWNLVAIAVETGLRREEQFGLRWDQVSMETSTVTIPLPKGGKTRHVPLSEGAQAILRSLDSFLRSPWVFPGLLDPMKPMDSRAFLRRAFEPALRKAGISGACWHTLRHTAASRRIMAGVDLYSVKEFLGHRDIETTLRYAHLAPGHLQEAVNRGSLFGTGTKTGTNRTGGQDDCSQPFETVARPEGVEPPTLRSVV